MPSKTFAAVERQRQTCLNLIGDIERALRSATVSSEIPVEDAATLARMVQEVAKVLAREQAAEQEERCPTRPGAYRSGIIVAISSATGETWEEDWMAPEGIRIVTSAGETLSGVEWQRRYDAQEATC